MNSHTERFPSVCRLIESRLGLSMDRGSFPGAFEQFIEEKMRVLGVSDEAVFANVLSCASEPLMDELIDAVTVPYSWLFRDYEQLYDAVAALATLGPRQRRLQVWVPACANGEDAYSVAALANLLRADVDVFATDINGRALELARSGRYGSWSTRCIPESHVNHLILTPDGTRVFRTEVSERVSFTGHNLLTRPPRSLHGHGGWNLVVCRNVLIYFARRQAMRVLENLGSALAPDGLLVLGASDIVLEIPAGLRTVDINGRLAFKRNESAKNGPFVLPPEKCRDTASTSAAVVLSSGDARVPALKSDPKATPVARPERPLGGTRPSAGNSTLLDSDDSALSVEKMLDGILQYLSGDLPSAAQSLRAALFHCSLLWPAAYYLALCLDELGRVQEAQREYQRTVDLIERKVVLPKVPNHDFTFLQRDISGLARRRAAGKPR